jgi:hypothetical protein
MAYFLAVYLFFSGINLIYLINLSVTVRMAFIPDFNIDKIMMKFIICTAKDIVGISIEYSSLNDNCFEDLEIAQIEYILIYISIIVRNLEI